MWFLIKMAFWFSLVLVMLSLFSPQSATRLENVPQVQASDAFTAATGAFQYVTSICNVKPEVCVKGGETLTALGYRAREGARVAYEFLDNRFKDGAKAKIADAVPALAPVDQLANAGTLLQPMPPRPLGTEPADAVITGTVKAPARVPVPQQKPAL
ncbi:DUF5330 domain-containing protein [Rhizobium sp. RAF56]|uniref:DUF5330 domain-containing protein n=1 Tax=Rhizobium sp. RAF56 TaxID=3233062 RepID=UPI003F97406B